MKPICGSDCSPEAGFVYILGCKEGYYKIGHARNVPRRFHSLTRSTKLPFKVWICYVFISGSCHYYERWFHRKFAHARTNGEWFKLLPADLVELEVIAIDHQATRDWGIPA